MNHRKTRIRKAQGANKTKNSGNEIRYMFGKPHKYDDKLDKWVRISD